MCKQLKRVRTESNLTQKEMSEKLGVSLSMYEKVERGYIQASRNFINKFVEQYPTQSIESIFFNRKQHSECS